MKSIIVDEDIHYLLRCVALKNRKNIKDSIHEAVVDIAKKYNVDVPYQLKIFEVIHE